MKLFIVRSIDHKNWIEVIVYFCVECKICAISGTIVERLYNIPGAAFCFDFLLSKRRYKQNYPHKNDVCAELNMTV